MALGLGGRQITLAVSPSCKTNYRDACCYWELGNWVVLTNCHIFDARLLDERRHNEKKG